MLYNVTLAVFKTDTIEVEADSEDEAVEMIAKKVAKDSFRILEIIDIESKEDK